METTKELLLCRANELVDTPYQWGGEGRLKDWGIDCSGFVQECLRNSFGRTPWVGDKTAAGQLSWWMAECPDSVFQKWPEKSIDMSGWFVYWLSSNGKRVVHIEIMLNRDVSIGARGDSRAKNIEIAKQFDMKIKRRAIRGRKNRDGSGRRIAAFVNPFNVTMEV